MLLSSETAGNIMSVAAAAILMVIVTLAGLEAIDWWRKR